MATGVPYAIQPYDPSAQNAASSFITYISPATMTAVDLAAALAAVQANAGGCVLVGPGAIDNTLTPVLGVFSNCTGVTIIGYGTTIQNLTPTTVPLGYALYFSNCTNVRVGGFIVTGTASATDIRNTTVKNQVFCAVAAGCVNVEIFDIKASGILTPFEVFNQDGAGNATTPIVRNVIVRNVQATNCWYGMDCQFGPEGLIVENLRTDTVHRSFFIYGATNVVAEIFSKDAWSDDVLLHGFAGRGNSNVTIIYHSDELSLARGDSAALVALSFDFSSGIIKHSNIKIVLDVKFAGAGTANTGECAFVIRKTSGGGGGFDTTDRGHILDGLDISGRIENFPFFSGFGLIDVDPNMKWGTALDSWYDINIHDLHSTSALFCRLSLASLKGTLSLKNVHIGDAVGGDFVLQQDDYSGAPDTSLPSAGRWSIENCQFANLRYFTANQALDPIRLISSLAIPVSYSGRRISNGGAVGAIMPVLPVASAGNLAKGLGPLTFLNVNNAGTFRVDPNGTDAYQGQGAGKYLDLAFGASVTIIPVAPNVWQIESSYGAVTFEP